MIERRRRRLAVLWLLIIAASGVVRLRFYDSHSSGSCWIVVGLFVGTLWLSALTARTLRGDVTAVTVDYLSPRVAIVYRAAAGLVLAAALVGFAWSLGARDYRQDDDGARSTCAPLALYFTGVAILAYRALVATGPRAAVQAIVLVLLLWIPFVLAGLVALAAQNIHASWGGQASELALTAILYAVAILAAVTLLAFRHLAASVPPAARALTG